MLWNVNSSANSSYSHNYLILWLYFHPFTHNCHNLILIIMPWFTLPILLVQFWLWLTVVTRSNHYFIEICDDTLKCEQDLTSWKDGRISWGYSQLEDHNAMDVATHKMICKIILDEEISVWWCIHKQQPENKLTKNIFDSKMKTDQSNSVLETQSIYSSLFPLIYQSKIWINVMMHDC